MKSVPWFICWRWRTLVLVLKIVEIKLKFTDQSPLIKFQPQKSFFNYFSDDDDVRINIFFNNFNKLFLHMYRPVICV